MDQHDHHSEAPPPYPGHPSEQHSHRDAHDTHPADPAPADKKREREATKKVDFYEKHYGFVPKNVLTEAEWKRIRKEAVKVKVPVKMRSKGYHYW
ncbi:Putative oxidoreductase [Verticillium dahliae VDG1]|nr:Putative oxidoreductase [Verticillium dahliae VDG1]